MREISNCVARLTFGSLSLIALTVALCSAINAQNGQVVEPETIGVIFWREPVTAALMPLDREVSHVKASPGFFKAKAKLRVNGVKATTRLKPDPAPEFVVQLATGVDPNKIKLYKLDVSGGRRETVILTVVAFSGAKAELKTLNMDVTRYGQNSYKLKPAQVLLPGEYVLVATDSTDAFCFGVDAALAP